MGRESNWSDFHRIQASTLTRLAQLTSDPDTAASLRRLAAQHEELADQVDSHRHTAVVPSVPYVVKRYGGNRKLTKTPDN